MNPEGGRRHGKKPRWVEERDQREKIPDVLIYISLVSLSGYMAFLPH
jgi:hypothetical protein